MPIIEKTLSRYCPLCRLDNRDGYTYYSVFRILFGLMFMQHGAQKLLGVFGGIDGKGAVAPLFSQFGLAGSIELIGGALIVLGLWTRLAALFAVIDMVAAYFIVHINLGLVPILNKGELVVLYFAGFLLMMRMGAGKWSLERKLFGKEIF